MFTENSRPKRRKVAVYIRVSTEEQKVDGYSLEAQKKRLLDYVESNVALCLETKKEWINTDTHTGSDTSRAGLKKLLVDVRAKKFDAVLVWKIDRLSRTLKHLLNLFEEFKDNKVSFISVQENIDFRGPIGSLIFQVFGAIAQFERELIKGRTRMGKIASAEMGNFTGTSIPFGYKKVKNKGVKGSRLEIIPKEKKWVKQIYNWYIFENMGYGQIAKKLKDLKVAKTNHTRNKRYSTTWTVQQVRTILTQPLYHGMFVANKTDEDGTEFPEDKWTINHVPPCISEFTFQQAQQAASDHKGGDQTKDYLLTGKLIDMDLEKPKKFVGKKRAKQGYSYCRKQFKDKAGVHHPVFEIPAEQMEEFVWSKVLLALEDPEKFIQHYLTREYADPKAVEKIEMELDSLREAKAKEELAIDRIEDAYERGEYSQEKMSSKRQKKSKEISRLEEQIQDYEDKLSFMSSIDVEVSKLREASEQVQYRIDKLDRKQKKILCNLFIERIEMKRREKPTTKKRKEWDIDADIIFRFNPKKLIQEAKVDSTSSALVKSKKGSLGPKNGNHGGRWKT